MICLLDLNKVLTWPIGPYDVRPSICPITMFVWFSSSLAILHSPNLFSLVTWPPGLEEGRGRNTQTLDKSLTLGLLVRLPLTEMECISGFAPCGFYQPLTHLKHLPWLSSITCLPWRSLSSHPLGTPFLLGFAFCFIHVFIVYLLHPQLPPRMSALGRQAICHLVCVLPLTQHTGEPSMYK